MTEWMSRFPALGRLAVLPRPVLLALGAALIAVVAVAAMWLREGEYRSLFTNLEARDGGAIVSVLNQRNIPYRFADNGTTLLVPADQVYALRLQLAEQGLPRGGSVGFELLDQPRFGASQFAEQVTYQRALEGELARSIEAMQPVRSARVHLAIPRQSLFVRERESPTASVLLTLYAGRSLSESQVSAIAWLVSSSVPKLNAAAVSIVDQDGHLLSGSTGQAGLDATRRNLVSDIEQRTVQRILTLLNPIVGTGNVRAQVTADVDFSQREQTSEVYRPNEGPGEAAIRSKQTSDSVQDGIHTAQGVPGALSNEPPPNALAPIQTTPAPGAPGQTQAGLNAAQGAAAPGAADPGAPGQPGAAAAATDSTATAGAADPAVPGHRVSTRNDATVNYELDRTISHVKHESGVLRRLSAAVVVNYREKDGEAVPLEPQELEKIDALVRQAMGFSDERGDTLSVVNSSFTETAPHIPVWENPLYQSYALQAGKVLFFLVVLFFLWRSILKPIIQGYAEAQVERVKLDARRQAAREQQRQEAERASEISRYEDNLDTARSMAQKDPRAVAMVLRSWMGKNEKS